MLLSLHPNTIVHVENVVSLFSSPSTSSQKKYESVVAINFFLECGQFVSSLPKFAEMLLENDVAFITA